MDSDETVSSYLKKILYSTFANGTTGALWWCFKDFSCSKEPPYEFSQLENDGLGILDITGHPKKFAEIFKKFSEFLNSRIDYSKVKIPDREIAIIVPETEDARGKIFASFLLCKMAKMNPDIIRPEDSFEKYKILILPSLSGSSCLRMSNWERIKKFVKEGGALYVSSDGIILTGLKEVFGIKVMGRKAQNPKEIKITFKGEEIKIKPQKELWDMHLKNIKAKIIGTNGSEPLILENNYGKGSAIFCKYPLERYLMEDENAINTGIFKIYQYLGEKAGMENQVITSSPFTEVVRLDYKDGEILVFINHGEKTDSVKIKNNGKIMDVCHGNNNINSNFIKTEDIRILQTVRKHVK